MIRIVLYAVATLAALAVGAALVAYLVATADSRPLTDAVRQQAGGDYLETRYGTLSYERAGPEDGPVVVLVHGFSTPKIVWEEITPVLVAAGYQVVAYDHLGRGFSDRPAGPYDAQLYRSEITGLIEGLELPTPLTLVGYSMGGANVVDYAASHPDQVRDLVLIAPAGYMPDTDLSIVELPIVGEWLAAVLLRPGVERGIAAEVEAGEAPSDMLEKFTAQSRLDGYAEALLSTLRHFPMSDLADRYRIVGRAGIPVTAIWGTADPVVAYAGAEAMAEDVPQLVLVTLEDENHSITYTRPERVSAAIVDALK